MTTTVYLMRDADAQPVYVGISDNLPSRMAVHRSQSPWLAEVASIETYECDTREDAQELESCIAAAYMPRRNVNLVPGRRWTMPPRAQRGERS